MSEMWKIADEEIAGEVRMWTAKRRAEAIPLAPARLVH